MTASSPLPSGDRVSAASRTASVVQAFALGGFVVLAALAMMAYPGGTSWDATTRGHDFWLNYLCDLERRTALNGAPNVLGAWLAQAAILMLALGVAPSWWSIARLFPRRTALAFATRWLGAFSSVGLAGAALFPNDTFGEIHPYLMALAGLPGLGAGACAVVGLASRDLAGAMVGAVVLTVCGADLVLYACHTGADAGPHAVAILERLSLILALAWMVFVVWRGRRLPAFQPNPR